MTIEIMDPTGWSEATPTGMTTTMAPRLAGDIHIPIGFLDSLKAGASYLLHGVQEQFESAYGVETRYWEKRGSLGSNGPLKNAAEIAASVGAVINAVADCGSCTSWTVHDSVTLELLGVPTVTLVTEAFEALATARAASLGLPGLRLVIVPHPVYTLPGPTLETIGRERFDEIISALTRPLYGESARPVAARAH